MPQLGTRSLTLLIGGTEYTTQVSECRIVSGAADNDFVPFSAAAGGGLREYKLKFKAVQDPATGTLWDLVWSQAGTTVVAVVRPLGNTTASATQPHFSGNVTIVEPDGDLLGGEANASTTARFTFEVEWTYTAKPTKVTA